MKSRIKKPFLGVNKLKSIQELEQDRKEKEDRFKEIAFSVPQPAAQSRKAKTPQEAPLGKLYAPTPPKVLSQGMTPQKQFQRQQGHPTPPSGLLSPQIQIEEKYDTQKQNYKTEYNYNQNGDYNYNNNNQFIDTTRNDQFVDQLRLSQYQRHDQPQQNIYIEPANQPFFFGDGIGVVIMWFKIAKNPVMQVRRNMAMSISDAVSESICFNTVLLFLSFGKVIAYLFLIMGSESCCKQSLTVWFLFMFIHDILYTYYTYLLLKTIRDSDYHEDPNAQGGFVQVPRRSSQIMHAGEPNHISNQFLNEVDEWDGQRQINAYAIQERASSSNRSTNVLNQVTKYLFIALFLVGNFIILGDEECPLQSPNHFDLAVFYLIIGYAYLGMPIILFSSLCLCLPFVLIMIMLLSRTEGQRPIRRDILESLERVKFSSQFQGNKDCCICMVDYKDGDDVTILPCNRMHHYHEECVKKWLLINGVCPICRKPIEDSVHQLQNREE